MMFSNKYIVVLLLFIGLISCQEKQDTLEGLVDASSHEKEFYDKQISFLDNVIAKKSSDATLYSKRGVAKLRKKDYAGAMDDLEIAIKLDSTNGEYFFSIATSHYFLGNMREAITNGKKALGLGFRHPQLKTFIGSAYSSLNQYDSALLFLENSLTEVPQNSKTFLALGNTYSLMNKYDLAIPNYQKAIDFYPLDTIAYAGLIDSYIILGDLDNAILTYQNARDARISSSELKYAQGLILNEQDNYDSAIVVFAKVLEENPTHWKSSRQLGKLYRRKRQPLEANKVFLEGLKFDPDRKELWYELGLTNHYVLRNYAEARTNYDKALQLDPTYQDARLALRKLRATLRQLYAPPVETEETTTSSEETQS